jgi:hypothetical protein
MAKESYWFKHDYNARSDRRLMGLLMKTGIEGIGIYWCVIEMLYEEGGFLLHSECERIAFELRTHCEKVKPVIESDLFKRDKEKFWSESVLRRLDERKDKSKKNSDNAFERWRKERERKEEEERQRLAQSENDASAMRTHNERIADELQSQCAGDANGMLIREEEKREDTSLVLSSISNEVGSIKEELELNVSKREVKKKEERILNIPFTSEHFLNKWQEWKAFKSKEYKFNYKSTQSEQAALNDLAAISNGIETTAIEIIQKSIANGWKGLFALKNTNNGASFNFTSTSTQQAVKSPRDTVAERLYQRTLQRTNKQEGFGN